MPRSLGPITRGWRTTATLAAWSVRIAPPESLGHRQEHDGSRDGDQAQPAPSVPAERDDSEAVEQGSGTEQQQEGTREVAVHTAAAHGVHDACDAHHSERQRPDERADGVDHPLIARGHDRDRGRRVDQDCGAAAREQIPLRSGHAAQHVNCARSYSAAGRFAGSLNLEIAMILNASPIVGKT